MCSLLLLSLLSSSPFPPLSSSSPLFPSSPFFPVGETRLFWFVWCFVVCFGLVLVVCVVVVFFVVGVLLSTVCWFGFVGCVVCCVLCVVVVARCAVQWGEVGAGYRRRAHVRRGRARVDAEAHLGARGRVPQLAAGRQAAAGPIRRVRGQVALIDGIGPQHGVKLAAVNST